MEKPTERIPLTIAGPCSAESEDQMSTTARALSRLKEITIFRAGVWKPRSQPNSFEGPGERGLCWHQKVKRETGLSTATEVARASHVELCLKYGIDVLWIGARTSVNPFYVQDIADALKGVDIPIIIKNPLASDISLWIGAIERIYKAGITKIIAVHRGFSTVGETLYRNAPLWEIPIKLKTLFPDIPLLCDPSHIAGKRNLVEHISQQAMSLGMNGLMLESHICPEKALSDSDQQITPKTLETLLQKVYRQNTFCSEDSFEFQLEKLRTHVDLIDRDIIESLSFRETVVKKIGELKKQNKVDIYQNKRFKELLEERAALGKKRGLRREYIRQLYNHIHRESLRIQEGLHQS